jgi:hypothetical protein
MNFKHTALILLFFMCLTAFFTGCGSLNGDSAAEAAASAAASAKSSAEAAEAAKSAVLSIAKPAPPTPVRTDARFIPITWDIVSGIQNAGLELKDLDYYLSNPFAMTIAVQKDTPTKMEFNERKVVIGGGQDITTRREEFTIADIGALRTIEASSQTLVINFKSTPLIFRRNSQGRYDLSSAEIDAIACDFDYEDRMPQLCVFAELNERLDVLVELGGSQRRTNVQQPRARDSGGGQPIQSVSVNNPAGQSSGRPSIYIDGTGSVNKRDVTNYVTRRNPSVDRAVLSRLIDTYFEEASDEGINRDIAIAQMLYATDFLRNRMATRNYAGLETRGARLNGVPWNGRFDDMRTGVKAHIQHLKGYASTSRPRGQIVDPRYQILVDLGYRGRVRTFDQLFERWSPYNDIEYGNSINMILENLYRF